MARRRPPTIAPRKAPRQARSTQLVEAILEAAIRVLERDGAAAFTTIRVAHRAGISVGSLYQYFPNKRAILFRLQQDEWAATARLLEAIFTDTRLAPATRLRKALRAFFRTEHDEAPLRRALGDAAALYRDAPEAREQRERGLAVVGALIDEAAPGIPVRRRAFAADLYIATMAAMGEQVSEAHKTPAEVETWAAAIGDMFIAYLRELARPRKSE